MNPEEKLDAALKYLYLEFEKNGSTKHWHSKFIIDLAKIDVTPHEAKQMMDKIYRDGYVDNIPESEWVFELNYNGIIFYRTGGYTGRLKDIKAERYRANLLNIITALGTGLAGLYALIEMMKWILKQISHCG